MYRLFARRFFVGVLSLSLMSACLPVVSVAGIISTQSMIEMERAGTDLARLESFIERENVRGQMISLGVNPAEVKERLAALTDNELRMLNDNIETMPAGGILAVIGVVFVVLLILEITGVIDIFKKV